MTSLDPRREAVLQAIEAQPLLSGRFANLRRVDQLGGGGFFSLVVFGTDLTSNTRVAIKFMDVLTRSDPYRIAAFHREPDVLQKLATCDRVISPITGIEELDLAITLGGSSPFDLAFPFYAMELADSSLEDHVYRSRFEAVRSLHLFREACKAVQAVHARGAVHRDIKLSNFLLIRGDVKLGDFGVARFHADPSLLTNYFGRPPGDLRHTPPEILAGLQDEEPRLQVVADMFSVGAVLFELFAATPLGLVVYEADFARDFIGWLSAVPPSNRRHVFDQVIGSVADARHIPSVAQFNGGVPRSILPHVDSMIRDTATLDYRRRPTDFSSLFRRIEICLIILRNEERERKRVADRRRRHALIGKGPAA